MSLDTLTQVPPGRNDVAGLVGDLLAERVHRIRKVFTHADIINFSNAAQGIPLNDDLPGFQVLVVNCLMQSSILGTTPYVGTGANDLQITDNSVNIVYFTASSVSLLTQSLLQLPTNNQNGSGFMLFTVNGQLKIFNPGADYTGGDPTDTVTVEIICFLYDVSLGEFV